MREKKRTTLEEPISEFNHNSKKINKTPLISIPVEILRDVQFNMIDVKLFQKNILDKSDLILLKSYSSNDEMVEILFELLRNKSEEHHSNFLSVIEEDYNWLRDKCEILLQKMRLDSLKDINKTTAKQDSDKTVTTNASTEKSTPDSITVSSLNKNMCSDLCTNEYKKCLIDENVKTLPEKKECHIKHLDIKKLNHPINSEMISVVRRNHRVVRGWTTLAHVLGMTSHVHVLRMRVLWNGEDMDTCIIHLLQEWKGRDPKSATLENLISALREESYNEVADELEAKFAV